MSASESKSRDCGVNIVGAGVDTKIVVKSEDDLEIVAAQIRKAAGLQAPASEQQQNEYICKCGIRVVPHRCQLSEEF